MKALTQQDINKIKETEAYQDKTHPEYKKVHSIVEQGIENLYPNDDRNIHPEKYYIWYTMDDDKVRSSHAERHGQVFSWDNPPKGGHPGEDYNCRCVAVKYESPYQQEDRNFLIYNEIEKAQALIDWKNGEIANLYELLQRIDMEEELLKKKLYQYMRSGFDDGVEGAEDASGLAAQMLETYRRNPFIEFENKMVGGVSGAIGVGYEEYKKQSLYLEKLAVEKQYVSDVIESNLYEIEILKNSIDFLQTLLD